MDSLTIVQLKEILGKRKQKISGNKSELILCLTRILEEEGEDVDNFVRHYLSDETNLKADFVEVEIEQLELGDSASQTAYKSNASHYTRR